MTTEVFVFGNNIDTSLTSAISSGTTTIPVASVSGFPTIPTGQYLALTLIHPATAGVFEIVYVTSVSGLNLTVLRGQEGSTAAAWASGDTIFSDVTQGVLQNFNNAIQYSEFSLGGTDTGVVNAYVVALTPPITSYKDGMRVVFRAANTNTGSSTLDAGGGARYIVQGANALQGYEILATVATEVIYDATNSQWILGTGAVRQLVQPAFYSSQVPNLSQLGALPTGMKNRIINGTMSFDQRNGGASGTAAGYTIDRWNYGVSLNGKGTWGQNLNAVTPPPNQTAYLGFQSSSSYTLLAADFFTFYQAIEAWNLNDFGWGTSSAKTVTISFWVYSSLTGTFSGVLKNYASTRTYPFVYTVSNANTWTYISVTVPGDTGGSWVLSGTGGGLFLQFNLGTGSTYSGPANAWANANYTAATGSVSVVSTNGATFYISGVQLEVGSVATQFDLRSDYLEFAMCQRYYNAAIYGIVFIPVAGIGNFGGGICILTFPPMRVAPSSVITSTNSSGWVGSLTAGATYANTIQIWPTTTETTAGAYNAFYVALSAEL